MVDTVANILNLSEMLELKVTLPLSSTTRKLKCRQFIKTDLTLPTIAKMTKLDTTYHISELENYRQHIWNIRDMKYDLEKETVTLTLSPYSYNTFKDKQDFTKNTNSSSSNTTNKANTSADGAVTLKCNNEFLKKTVERAIGSKKNLKAQADACISSFNQNHTYHLYYDFNYGKDFKRTWNARGLNCGDGAFVMCSMLACLGLHPYMKLASGSAINRAYGHYWGVVKIQGKTYYFDHANGEGMKGRAKLSTSGISYGDNAGSAGSIVQKW